MYPRVKRFFDITLALFLLFTLWPLFLLIGLAVAFFIGTPVIFKQKRTGFLQKDFWIYKFRTMKNALNENGHRIPDAERLNIIGRWMRSFSLDELPQLYNILRGDMSFIGPRPQMAAYTQLCNDYQKQRFLVKPGITGWAQVHGRNQTTWDERYNYDVEYALNMGPAIDIKILLMTIPMVIKRSGVLHSPNETMPHPKGYTPSNPDNDIF